MSRRVGATVLTPVPAGNIRNPTERMTCLTAQGFSLSMTTLEI